MLKIKLARTGSKNHPTFRIVVAERRSKLTGAAVDLLGFYLPLEKKFNMDKEKYAKWVEKGAKPTPELESLLKSH